MSDQFLCETKTTSFEEAVLLDQIRKACQTEVGTQGQGTFLSSTCINSTHNLDPSDSSHPYNPFKPSSQHEEQSEEQTSVIYNEPS